VEKRCRGVMVVALIASIGWMSPAVMAQRETGAVQGRVLDTTGLPLPGVLVEVESGGAILAARTGDDGRYEVTKVPPGPYAVRFSLPNFVTTLRRDVALAPGDTVTQNAMLYVAATASVVVSGRSTFRNLATVGNQDELIGVADAASTGVISPAELNERARRRPAEALESVPGMVVSQHSGEGKANQYYLRGFNIDHGTDLALSVAGMPVNLPTHEAMGNDGPWDRPDGLPGLHTTVAVWDLWIDRGCGYDRGQPSEPARRRRVGRRLSREPLAGARCQRRLLAGAVH
jgi:hypothetical protein